MLSAHESIEFIAALQRMPTLDVIRIAAFSDSSWERQAAKKERARRDKNYASLLSF